MNEAIRQAIDTVGSGMALASAIARSPQFVSQMLRGERPVPAELCPSIERATAGLVMCERLRPDVDWAYIRNTSAAALPAPLVAPARSA